MKRFTRFLLLALAFAIPQVSFADDDYASFYDGDFEFEWFWSGGRAECRVIKYNGTSSDVIIPPTATWKNKTLPVVEIRYDFETTTASIKTVFIPNTIDLIYSSAFNSLPELQEINVDADNSKYSSEDGVLYNKSKSEIIRYPRGRTSAFTLPSSVTTIGGNAFYGCSFEEFIIPNTITDLGVGAFSHCKNLSFVKIPESVTYIGDYTFSGCAFEEFIIPNTITGLGENAFWDCENLSFVKIPESVTYIGDDAFNWCNKQLILKIYGNPEIEGSLGNSSSVVICTSEALENIKSHVSGSVYAMDCPFKFNIENFYAAVKITAIDNPYFDEEFTSLTLKYEILDGGEIISSPEFSSPGECVVPMIGDYTFRITASYDNGEVAYITEHSSETRNIEITCKINKYNITPTSFRVFVSAPTDEFSTPTEVRLKITAGDSYYIAIEPGSWVTVNDLPAGNEYVQIQASAYYVDEWFFSKKADTRKPSLFDGVVYLKQTPTSVTFKPVLRECDVNESKIRWEWYKKERGYDKESLICEQRNLDLSNLIPGGQYDYTLKIRYTGAPITYSFCYTSPKVEWTLLDPRCVSEKCAIVAASTNLSDEETKAGFQWKKVDAPASLKPTESFAVIYDGQLEGYIKNLQPTYYNARAFFEDANGDRTYSEWVTFDPTDFSYFEPTVHTYPVEMPEANSAYVRGYALAGSDPIEWQGFEYWLIGTDTPESVQAAADNVMTVEAKGQVMTATLTDLIPGTSYCVRSLVKTDNGDYYGEEQTFTTPETGGIEGVTVDQPSVEIVGYYDLSGRRHNAPQQGFNIVAYSDGTTKKLFIRE